ncbi:lipase family protein [Aquirhabdus parva]|uniref:Alpha/beta hydrolase n=1 Tax=Aquirhabdus parva TaxID=2283318 RepID=A0A345P9Y4_9GAMM|nr:alpha/beta hydrolase [Aquirhabdus parva]AXI04093.1 alpha/beta hydrolase [Aquirhabdus parva]
MARTPIAWRPTVPTGYRGPCIALIHGLAAGKHMERHLLSFLRAHGYPDTTLYSNHLYHARIAKDLAVAAKAGRPIVLIGYSQGGIQVVKVARKLGELGYASDLVISLAAGGLGRWFPAQWGFDMRKIPASVKRYLNYFAASDVLGTDRHVDDNLAHAESAKTHLENIRYPLEAGVDHFAIVRCYPAKRVLPEVQTLFLDRLLTELSQLDTQAE